MNKFALVIILMICSLALAEVGERHIEKDGGFSYCPPKEWIVREYPGLKYNIIVGPRDDTFTTNINFIDEKYDSTLEKYVKNDIDAMNKNFDKFKIIKNVEFITSKKLIGILVITSSIINKIDTRNNNLYFKGVNGKIISITLSCLASTKNKYDDIFEESMKTFELIK